MKNEPFLIEEGEQDDVSLKKVTHFHGNAVYFFKTYFYVEEEMTVGIQIGKNTPISVWLNDEFLASKEGNETFYHEVIHKLAVTLKAGVNTLTFKVINNTEDTKFSYAFLKNGVCSEHYMFEIVNPRKVHKKFEGEK